MPRIEHREPSLDKLVRVLVDVSGSFAEACQAGVLIVHACISRLNKQDYLMGGRSELGTGLGADVDVLAEVGLEALEEGQDAGLC